jgi:ABC transporter substrate binding protein
MRVAAIREGLSGSDNQRELSPEISVRLADGDVSRLPELATDLVNNRVDAILAAGPRAVQAAAGATTTIPVIAIDLESDPIGSGFVKSLARPGGNVTGVFLDFPDFSANGFHSQLLTRDHRFRITTLVQTPGYSASEHWTILQQGQHLQLLEPGHPRAR